MNFKEYWAKADDWINPIVVKEMRQSFNGRGLLASCGLLLIVNLLVFAVVAANVNMSSINEGVGREFIGWSLLILTFGAMFGAAYPAASRFAEERRAEAMDLIYITTLTAPRLINGKFLSVLVLNFLMFSLCLPSLVLSYYLRGVAMEDVLFFIGISFCISLVLTQFLLLCGTLGSWVLRGALVICGIIVFSTYVGVISTMHYHARGMLEFFTTCSIFCILCFIVCYVLTLVSLLPPSANRMLPVRSTFLVVDAALLPVLLGLLPADGWDIWLVLSVALASLTMVMAVMERLKQSKRVLQKLPNSALLRCVYFLVSSGSAGGVCYALLLGGGSFGLYFGLHGLDPRFHAANLMGFFMYIGAYTAAALLLLRLVERRWRSFSGAHAWVVVAVFAIVVSVLSTVVTGDSMVARCVTPIGFMESDSEVALAAAGGWLLVFLVLNLPDFWRQFREYFEPVEPEEASYDAHS